MNHRLLLLGLATAVAVCLPFAGCSCSQSGLMSLANRTESGAGESDPILAQADPERAAVEQAVRAALAARIAGDAAALKALCTSELAGQIKELAPRPLTFAIERVQVLCASAAATVLATDPAAPADSHPTRITYTLQRQAGGWKLSRVDLKTVFGG